MRGPQPWPPGPRKKALTACGRWRDMDTSPFLSLAEIAGVFVGFGALIAVRSGGPRELDEVAYMRTVVAMGLLTVVAALAPVTLGRYELTEHQVLALSGALALVGFLGMIAVSARTPEYRAGWAASTATTRLTPGEVVGWAVYVLYMIGPLFAPIIIILGVAPELEPALYRGSPVRRCEGRPAQAVSSRTRRNPGGCFTQPHIGVVSVRLLSPDQDAGLEHSCREPCLLPGGDLPSAPASPRPDWEGCRWRSSTPTGLLSSAPARSGSGRARSSSW